MGTTFLCAVEVPDCGGDALYLNSMDAYDKVSPQIQSLLETLSAVHSGEQQAVHGVKTSVYRRQFVETIHPIVRKHPVTGRKGFCGSRRNISVGFLV
jgi:sulfonate dioxygenase